MPDKGEERWFETRSARTRRKDEAMTLTAKSLGIGCAASATRVGRRFVVRPLQPTCVGTSGVRPGCSLGGAGMNHGFVGAAASALANHGQEAAVEVSTGELALR